MAHQNPTLALNVISDLKKAALVESPATIVDQRYVVVGTRATPGTAPSDFIAMVKKRVGDRLFPGAEAMLEQTLLNYPGSGELVLKLAFETAGTASAFERNVMPILEDLSDIVGKRIKFFEPFPTVKDGHGVFKLACVGITSPPAMHEVVKILQDGGTPDKGSVAIWALTEKAQGLGRFSFAAFDSCKIAARIMTSEGIEVSGERDMVILARRCVDAGAAEVIA